ncbi:MAG: hydrogenase maturation protease [Chloroflexi bacterium]|nr:hydrogenase maturation protease [Chloroflexota bacterium]
MPTMIAGVGYQNLRDFSVGPALVPTLQKMKWPKGVEIDDWSFGPIAVVQRLQDRPGFYDRIIFISAVEREREPGGVYVYRWKGKLPDTDEIQARIGEAVTGVISLDNLLIIATHFQMLPRDVFVIEVEPVDTGWGSGFTPQVQAAQERIIASVKEIVGSESLIEISDSIGLKEK